jgi:protein required for attachment to host cells
MPAKWVVVADASRARIFETRALGRGLHEIEDMPNPVGRARSNDLLADAGGRSYASAGARQGHTTQPRTDPVEHEVEMFAKRLADRLERARCEGRFEQLYVIAAPRFLGLLRGKRSKEIERLIEREIAKDVAQLDTTAIASQLWG